MKKNVFILVLVMVGMMALIILGCNSKGINFWGNSSIGGFVPAIGKVSNTFGSSLGRDIDRDTDNDNGVILNNIASVNNNDGSNSLWIDGSGKVYVTGVSDNGSNNDAYVIRLNSDGSIDSGFGVNLGRDINGDGNTNDYGVILSNIADGSGYDYGISITIDGSGKVYVTGYSQNASGNADAYVIRLNSNGNMDGTFGSGGKVILSNIAGGNGDDVGRSLWIDGSGKVYVTGVSDNGSNNDVYVIRLNSDGSIDSGFGVNLGRDINGDGNTNDYGVILSNIAGSNGDDVGRSLWIDGNEKIYVTGRSWNGSNNDAYVIKLDNNGSIDSSFGSLLGRDINGDGNTNDYGVILSNIASVNSDEDGNSLSIDVSGKVYITGYSWNGTNADTYVIRLNSNGNMDGTFGSGGKVILTDIAGGNGDDVGRSLWIDGSGKVYVTGESDNGSNFDTYVIRLNSDGSMDSSFGSEGKVILTNIAGGNGDDTSYSRSLWIYSGNVYVTGWSWNGSEYDAYVIKIE